MASLHQQVTGSQKNAPGNQANSKDYRLKEPIWTHLKPVFHFLKPLEMSEYQKFWTYSRGGGESEGKRG